MKRTQIYLDEQQHERLSAEAARRGVTSSAVIRDAIDRYLRQEENPLAQLNELKTLGRLLAQTPEAEGPSGAEVVEELRRASAERLSSRE
ncbi:MAG: ribbon-helix-helix protein, CopG family [Salinibacterium sp.]|nr:MAG: ribbon-helix-helix protein, CopG family [Salinibacterium sp.]